MKKEKEHFFETVREIVDVIEAAERPHIINEIHYARPNVKKEIIFKMVKIALEAMGQGEAMRNIKTAEEILKILESEEENAVKMVEVAEIFLTGKDFDWCEDKC